jgi:hypothetical protein
LRDLQFDVLFYPVAKVPHSVNQVDSVNQLTMASFSPYFLSIIAFICLVPIFSSGFLMCSCNSKDPQDKCEPGKETCLTDGLCHSALVRRVPGGAVERLDTCKSKEMLTPFYMQSSCRTWRDEQKKLPWLRWKECCNTTMCNTQIRFPDDDSTFADTVMTIDHLRKCFLNLLELKTGRYVGFRWLIN